MTRRVTGGHSEQRRSMLPIMSPSLIFENHSTGRRSSHQTQMAAMMPNKSRSGRVEDKAPGTSARRSAQSPGDIGASSHHPNGELCLAGTRKVPRGFIPCCERFDQSTLACTVDIRFEWWSKSASWVVRIADGGSSGQEVAFCPYCGVTLARHAASKRRRASAGRRSLRK